MMEKTGTPERPLTTLVISPRERFSVAERALRSLIEHSDAPYELIYVDAGSPPRVRDALARLADEHGFQRIRTEHFLSPNTARNLGLAKANGRYVVFVENDVIASPGWLSKLVDCAEETGATVVSPLICGGSPLHSLIHCAGGTCAIVSDEAGASGQRFLYEKIERQDDRGEDVRGELRRCRTGLAEFHCMLVHKEYLDRYGPLDEQVLNTREHVDLCIEVAQNGGSVWLEPESVVTYLYDAPLQRSDYPYFMIRWGDRWERASLAYLLRKYGIGVDEAMRKRLKRVGWRRREFVIRPFVHSLTGGRGGELFNRGIEFVVTRVERGLNRLLYAWNDRRASRAPGR